MAKKIRDISSISEYDYSMIIGSYISMADPEYDCRKCKLRYRGDHTRQTKHQERKGCFKIMDNAPVSFLPRYHMAGSQKVNFHKCIAQVKDDFYAQLIGQHEYFNRGIMPYSGGMDEQPARFVELMKLIGNVQEEIRQQEESKTKHRKRLRGKQYRS